MCEQNDEFMRQRDKYRMYNEKKQDRESILVIFCIILA